MPCVSQEERLIALGMIQSNIYYIQDARSFGCSKTAIKRSVRRHAVTRSTNDRPRTGRERLTTPEQERGIRLMHLQDHLRSASRSARKTPGRYNPQISADTVRRRFRQRDLRYLRPYHREHSNIDSPSQNTSLGSTAR